MESIIQEYLDMLNEEIALAKGYSEKYIECKIKNDKNAIYFYNMTNDSLAHATKIHEIIHEVLPAEYLQQWKTVHDKFELKVGVVRTILG